MNQPLASTFLFADLAGFTALTEAHGDDDAADLAQGFAAATAPLLPKFGAEQVKTIGDALILRVEAPADAVNFGLVLANDLLAGHGYPAVRVGMHHGPAVRRGHDWYGATVNIAARIADIAAGGEVLASEVVRTLSGDLTGVEFRLRGRHRLRNVGTPMDLFVADRVDAERVRPLIDPVCRMVIDPAEASHRLLHDGVEHYFCSSECATRFAATPSVYAEDD